MITATSARTVNSLARPAIMHEGAMLETAKEAGMNRHQKTPATGPLLRLVGLRLVGLRLVGLTLVGLSLVAPVGATGCAADNATAFIDGMLRISPDDGCVVNPNAAVFDSGALLDLGRGANDANALVLAPRVVINLPNTYQSADDSKSDTQSPNYPNYGYADNNTINFTAAEVHLSTDADRDGTPMLANTGTTLPTDENNPRRIGVGGTVYNTQSQLNTASAIISTAITTEDAASLQGAAYVSEQIGVSGRARILVNLRLTGVTTGAAEVRTPPFVFPVELCQGCLVQDAADCVSGQTLVDTGCVRGVDYPTICQ